MAGSQRPTRYVDLRAIRCPSLHYVGAQDWIADHVRADAAALGAPLEVLPGATHLSAFSGAAAVLGAVRRWLPATG